MANHTEGERPEKVASQSLSDRARRISTRLYLASCTYCRQTTTFDRKSIWAVRLIQRLCRTALITCLSFIDETSMIEFVTFLMMAVMNFISRTIQSPPIDLSKPIPHYKTPSSSEEYLPKLRAYNSNIYLPFLCKGIIAANSKNQTQPYYLPTSYFMPIMF